MASCHNCLNNTTDNGTPATATTAAVPPDARCPGCGIRVEDMGTTPPRWPDVIPAGAVAHNLAVDPATGAVVLPAGAARAPWIFAPPVVTPTPTPVAAPARDWRPIAGGVVFAVLAVTTTGPSAGGGGTGSAPTPAPAPVPNPPAPQPPTVTDAGTPNVPPPAPSGLCGGAAGHPRPDRRDLTVSGAGTPAAPGAPADCVSPPTGVAIEVEGSHVWSWYCCTP